MVKGSIKFVTEVIFFTIMSSLITIYQVILPLYVFILLVVSWFFRMCDYPIVIIKQHEGWYSQGYYLSPIRNFLSQMTFFTTSKTITYLTSIVKLTIQDCFTLIQLRAPPPRVNTNADVNLWESIKLTTWIYVLKGY